MIRMRLATETPPKIITSQLRLVFIENWCAHKPAAALMTLWHSQYPINTCNANFFLLRSFWNRWWKKHSLKGKTTYNSFLEGKKKSTATNKPNPKPFLNSHLSIDQMLFFRINYFHYYLYCVSLSGCGMPTASFSSVDVKGNQFDFPIPFRNLVVLLLLLLSSLFSIKISISIWMWNRTWKHSTF